VNSLNGGQQARQHGAREPLHVERVCRLAHNSFWLTLEVRDGADPLQLARGQYIAPLPLKARVLKHGRIGDLFGTGWATLHVISERFRQLLDLNQLTGSRALPVEIIDYVLDMPVYLLAVTGRCGSEYGSGGRYRPGLPPFGMFLDPLEWDGSDLFTPTNSGVVLFGARAANVVRRARLRNVQLEPAHYRESGMTAR